MPAPLRPLQVSVARTAEGLRIAVSDPLGLLDQALLLTPELYWIACHLDGASSLEELLPRLRERAPEIDEQLLRDAVRELDRHLLLDSPRFRRARDQARERFLAAGRREPRHAEGNYPAEGDACREHLDELCAAAPADREPAPLAVRAVVSPHIDFGRGGEIYARTWGPLRELRRPPRRVIALGTSHAPLDGCFGFCPLPYATPFGVLPHDQGAVEHLRAALPEAAHGEALCHRHEHSLEFQAVWSAYAFGAPRFVPLLVGSFLDAEDPAAPPRAQPWLEPWIDALSSALAELADAETTFVAGVDLAHIGPHFGDEDPLEPERLRSLAHADEASLRALESGDADAFWSSVAADGDARRVCGLAPLYLLLRTLEKLPRASAQRRGYAQCTSPDQCVSIAGMWFS
ncbi:MAG: AmmeMemoRadiSam system protein B [Planctomycetes bacterium]|nr:AmmeMemoRadiSam system protein B [Planctomycetota bacterium]